MDDKNYLVKFSSDWSDEFQMEGFKIFTEEQLKEFNNQIDNAEYPLEAGFGTNEWFDFESPDDVRRELIITKISVEEVKVLEKLFDGEIGWVPEPSYWDQKD